MIMVYVPRIRKPFFLKFLQQLKIENLAQDLRAENGLIQVVLDNFNANINS